MTIDAAFRDMPIRRKLQAIIFIISGVAVLGSCAAFLTNQWFSSRQALARQHSVMAEIVADQCSAAVEFAQVPQATEILGSLKAEPQVMAAAIYSSDGQLFASYLRDGVVAGRLAASPGSDGTRLEDGELVVFRPVLSDGERVGTFHLRSDMSEARRRLARDLVAVGLIVLVAAVAIRLLSARLGGLAVEPVLRLATVVEAVSARKDYSVRVEPGGRDEMGHLIAGFNEMLAEVEARDDALARARDDLDLRVKERTRELEEEIAERKAAEKLLEEKGTALAAANRELEAFSYSVSHDLRAPLRAMDGFSRMLLEDCGDGLDETGRRYAGIIIKNARKMGALIDELLAFSRMARTQADPRAVDMTELAHDAWAELTEQPSDRQLELHVGELPQVRGDRAMLRQVFVNLLSNGIKYTRGRDPAIIEVGASSEGGVATFHVKDNGVGFDMAYAQKLFGVFQRLHAADEFEGTGVGLALVQRIVQRHGGRVWADAALGRGATFYFTLPSIDADVDRA